MKLEKSGEVSTTIKANRLNIKSNLNFIILLYY